MKGAVMTGRITDAYGRPIPGLNVAVQELRTHDGAHRLYGVTGRSTAVTDDRGVYRTFGLPPGSYVINAQLRVAGTRVLDATPEATGLIGYVPVYFPGTTSPPDAGRILLAAGEERDGLDFVVRPVPMARVSGAVSGPDGSPVAGVRLSAFPAGGVTGIVGIGAVAASASAQGQFTFIGLAPGRHTVQATRTTGEPLWAETTIEVGSDGSDITNLSLQLQPTMSVSGRLVFEGQSVPLAETLRRAFVRVEALLPSGRPMSAPRSRPLADDGTFEVPGLLPGRYAVSASAPSGTTAWTLKTATSGGRDLIALPLEVMAGTSVTDLAVTMASESGLSGRLLDRAGNPAPEYVVLVFPADRRRWSLGASRLVAPIRPGTDGRYEAVGLIPGQYHLAALTEIGPEDHLDSTFLEGLVSSSITIAIGPGERKVQDVRIGG